MQQIASPTNDSLIQAQLHCPDEHFFFSTFIKFPNLDDNIQIPELSLCSFLHESTTQCHKVYIMSEGSDNFSQQGPWGS